MTTAKTVCVVAVTVAYVAVRMAISNRRERTALFTLAQQLGVSVRDSWHSRMISDEYHGRHLLISSRYKKSEGDYCVVELTLTEPRELRFGIRRRSIGTAIGSVFKRLVPFGTDPETTLGDPAFDADWRITTNHPDLLKNALPNDVCMLIQNADSGRSGFECDGRVIRYTTSGELFEKGNQTRIVQQIPVIEALACMVETLSRASDTQRH